MKIARMLTIAILPACITCTLCQVSFGQTFPTSNAQWHTARWDDLGHITQSYYHYWTEFLDGDTVINNETYHILKLDAHCTYCNIAHLCNQTYTYPGFGIITVGAMRETEGRVVFRKFDTPHYYNVFEKALKEIPADYEIVLYDTSWVIGDIVHYPLYSGDSLTFEVVYSTSLQSGKKQFVLNIKDQPNYLFFVVEEGLGGRHGLFNMYYHNVATAYYAPHYNCLIHNDTLVFGGFCENPCQVTNVDFLSTNTYATICPNPAKDVIQIGLQTTLSNAYVLILDQTGRQVNKNTIDSLASFNVIDTSAFSPGLYTVIIYQSGVPLQQQRFVIAR
jgi:hypothetical protein